MAFQLDIRSGFVGMILSNHVGPMDPLKHGEVTPSFHARPHRVSQSCSLHYLEARIGYQQSGIDQELLHLVALRPDEPITRASQSQIDQQLHGNRQETCSAGESNLKINFQAEIWTSIVEPPGEILF